MYHCRGSQVPAGAAVGERLGRLGDVEGEPVAAVGPDLPRPALDGTPRDSLSLLSSGAWPGSGGPVAGMAKVWQGV